MSINAPKRRGGVRVRDGAGSPLPQRPYLNAGSNITATDDAANGQVVLDASGGGGGGFGGTLYITDAPYNADPTGVNDSTAAIKAAIADAEAAWPYKEVVIPFGNFKINSGANTTPIVHKPIRVRGLGCWQSDRKSNWNYECGGSVLVNHSTTQDGIRFEPGTDPIGGPRGLMGVIFQDFGVTTPDPGISPRVAITNRSAWGPFSSGIGICLSALTGTPYGCRIQGCVVTRHAIGFNTGKGIGTGGTVDRSGSTANHVIDCGAFLCNYIGFALFGIETRARNCIAKNDGPEWGPLVDKRPAATFASVNPVLANGTIGLEKESDSSNFKFKVGNGTTAWNSLSYGTVGDGGFPATGQFGFALVGDGSWVSDCTAITCFYGFAGFGDAGGLGVGTGAEFAAVQNSGVDSSYRPLYFTLAGGSIFNSIWGVPSPFCLETDFPSYPASPYDCFTLYGVTCSNLVGGGNIALSGCNVTNVRGTNVTVSGSTVLSNATLVGNLVRSTGFSGLLSNIQSAGVTGSAGSSKGRNLSAVADWG